MLSNFLFVLLPLFFSLSSFIFLLSFLCPFFFLLFFSFSLLFSRSSCFLFSFLSLLVYRTRAHAYARVLGFDTHGGVVKNAFRCAVFETLFFARSFCGYQSRRPVRRYWLFVCFPGSVCFPLCFCVRNASTAAPFSLVCISCVRRCSSICLFFAFFCPLTPFFASLVYSIDCDIFRPFIGLFFKLMTVRDKKCCFSPPLI